MPSIVSARLHGVVIIGVHNGRTELVFSTDQEIEESVLCIYSGKFSYSFAQILVCPLQEGITLTIKLF